MSRKLIAIALSLSLAPVCLAAGPHFRKASWGMTPDEVKKLEQRKPETDEDQRHVHIIGYADNVAGYDMLVAYIFVQNKLVRAKYMVAEKWVNKNSYLEAYDHLLEGLTQKYGSPTKNDTVWKNDLYKSDPSDWGMAVSVGHLVKFSQWDTTETTVSLVISGEQFDVTCAVEYRSKALRKLEEDAEKAQQNEKL